MSLAGSPIEERERSEALDALRGFALLGIFVSHVPDFSGHSFLGAEERAALDRLGVDRSLAPILELLIRGKFFSLFSLLFGIGFAVQLESARRRGADFARQFARRLGVLFAIGIAHAALWYGDILKDYAVIGFALLVVARWPAGALAWAAAAAFLLRILWPVLIAGAFAVLAQPSGDTDPGTGFSELARTFGGGDLAAIASANLALVRLKALQLVYDGKALSILAMFLLGAWMGRLGVHRDVAGHRPALRRALRLCLPIGVLGNAALVPLHAATPAFPPTAQWAAEQVLFGIAVPALTVAYASGFALLWSRGADTVLRRLAPAGRMALTTYVSQSLIGVSLFYGLGLGLHGRVGLAEGTLVALGIFALQCALAARWLRSFRFGPLEWLWRRATYGVRVPMLRRPRIRAAAALR
jgi:uncharacterized protein